jgi:hypothetical protein
VAFRYFTEPPPSPSPSPTTDIPSTVVLTVASINDTDILPNEPSPSEESLVGDDDNGDANMSNGCYASVGPTFIFLGLLGVFTMITCLPLLALAHVSGIEVFHWPSSNIWPTLILSAAMVCYAIQFYAMR